MERIQRKMKISNMMYAQSPGSMSFLITVNHTSIKIYHQKALVGNIGGMSAECRHKRHVSVIWGRHDNSANTGHQISCVISQFGVVVCTEYIVVLTNHKWPVISRPYPFLTWWHTHAIHSSQPACPPGWISWNWSCTSSKRRERSTYKK